MSLLYFSDGYLAGMAVWLTAGVASLVLLIRAARRLKTDNRRATFVKLAISCWILLASLTAVELYFALIHDTTDSFNMTNVSKKWFDMHIAPQQKVVEFDDGQGSVYRDDQPFPKTLKPGQYHICFVGDSFTFGQGMPNVADRFSNRLGAALEKEQPGRFVVSNLSDAGRDLHWIQVLLEELFRNNYPIDTIVYVACLNDIETFHERHRTYYTDLGSHSPKFFLFRDTYFFNMLYFRVRQFSVPDVRDYYSFVREYYSGEPWQRMKSKLDEVHALCQYNDVELRIVVFPFLHNLGPDYPFRDAHRQFVDYCNRAGIRVLDLEPVLRDQNPKTLTVNRFDAHPNELAHKLAAEAIRTKLFGDL